MLFLNFPCVLKLLEVCFDEYKAVNMTVHRKNPKKIKNIKNMKKIVLPLDQYHHIKLEHICKAPWDMLTCEPFGGAWEWQKNI